MKLQLGKTSKYMELGNRLKEWRAKKNITQEALANAIEMSRQTVNAIERGRFIPSVLTAFKMAKFFETTIEELFFIQKEAK